MTFSTGKILLFLYSNRPPCQGLVGNLLWEKGRGGTLFFLGHTHLEFILRCHNGIILSHGEIWGQVHTMDYTVAAKRSRCAWDDEYVPYPPHQVGYQRFREKFGVEVLQLSAHIHLGGNGFPWHLLAWYDILVCCQNWAKIQTEKVRLWICESEAREKVPPNHRTKNTAKAWKIKKTWQSLEQRATLKSQRRKQESGASSISGPLTTPVSVGPSSH